MEIITETIPFLTDDQVGKMLPIGKKFYFFAEEQLLGRRARCGQNAKQVALALNLWINKKTSIIEINSSFQDIH
jgi:hypothetical protein